MLLLIMRYCRQEVYIRGVLIWELAMLLFNIKYTVENSCHTFSHSHANNNFYSAISVLDCLFNKVAFGTFYSY